MPRGSIDAVNPPKKPLDVALLGERTEDGAGRRVLRLRESGAAIGEVRPLAHGKPLPRGAEIVKLSPREGAPPHVCDVETQLELGEGAARGSGPARIASEAYRDGWERVFASRGGAPN
ncbi:MAG: hypothetical protein IT374_22035 [Polyangiaceae bacterium]|nr:hypothetical protein [Polyangiaceae bacterium]